MNNEAIARRLIAQAHTLSERDDLYRRRAYRRAAETVLSLDEPVGSILEAHGRRGLRALPGIGRHIAAVIEALVRTGEFPTVSPKQMRREDHRCCSDCEPCWR